MNFRDQFSPLLPNNLSRRFSPSSITKKFLNEHRLCAISSKNKIEDYDVLKLSQTNAGFYPNLSANSVRESPDTSLNSISILAAISFRVKSKSKSFS